MRQKPTRPHVDSAPMLEALLLLYALTGDPQLLVEIVELLMDQGPLDSA